MRQKIEFLLGIMLSVCLLITMFKTGPTQALPEDIKIGIVGPVGLPQWSPAGMKEGAELAAQQINDAGGVNVGGTYRNITIVEGNECSFPSIDVAEAQAEVVRLYNEGCRIVIGGFRTEVTGPMIEMAMGQEYPYLEGPMIFLINGASPDELISDRVPVDYPVYKYLFRIMPANLTTHLYTLAGFSQYVLASLAPVYGEYLWPEAPNPQIRVAVLTEELDWTLPMHQYLTNPSIYPSLLGPCANVTYADRVPPSAMDLSSYIANIILSEARIVIHVFYGVVGFHFGAQWGAANANASLVGINAMAQLQSYWEATEGLCEFETIVGHFGTRTPIVLGLTREFWDNFLFYTEQRHGTPQWPTSTAFGAYNGIYAVIEAIETAGTTDSDAVVSALETQERMALNGIARFTAASIPHDVFCNSIGPTWPSPQYTRAFMVQWQNGKLEVVWPMDQSYSKNPVFGGGVRVTGIWTPKDVIGEGLVLEIKVTVTNQGFLPLELPDFMGFTAYYDDDPIDSLIAFNLDSGDSTILTFDWNTTGVTRGNYTISARETYPTIGDVFIDGTVLVTFQGDVNGDLKVRVDDILAISLAFGLNLGDPDYDPNLDVNGDDKIRVDDILIAALNFGLG